MVKEHKTRQTKFGLIPDDWQFLNLEDNFTLKARIGWQGLTTAEYLKNGDFVLVTGTDFKNGYIDWNNCVFVEKMRFDQDRNIQLRNNDVLVTKDGTIGKIAYIDFLPKPTTLNSGVFVVRPKYNNVINRFFYYVLMSFYFDDFLLKITAGSTITHLYQKDFVNFNFVCPPLPEQKAISEALSDADAWIESLEQLIAKKLLIKQGAMQELLTPKEDWEVKKLGKMCQLITKGTTPTSVGFDFTESGINFIKVESLTKNGNIEKGKIAFINERCNEVLSRSQIKEGDILFSIAGALGRVAIVKKEIVPANTNQALGIIRLEENNIDRNYLYYTFNKNDFQQMLNTISVTGAQPNLSLQNLNEFEIIFPSLTEQTRIATILSDMDAEIKILEQKLNKAFQIKQGMMQELLTGRVRLV